MGKLANIARNILGTDGEYISLNQISEQYPEGVTINGAFIRCYTDRENGKVTETPCFTFAEDANKYFYAVSGDVARLYENWLNNCNKDINELAESLRYENIKTKIFKVKTKSGKTYTKALVVDVIEKPRLEESEERVDPETGEILSENMPF